MNQVKNAGFFSVALIKKFVYPLNAFDGVEQIVLERSARLNIDPWIWREKKKWCQKSNFLAISDHFWKNFILGQLFSDCRFQYIAEKTLHPSQYGEQSMTSPYSIGFCFVRRKKLRYLRVYDLTEL